MEQFFFSLNSQHLTLPCSFVINCCSKTSYSKLLFLFLYEFVLNKYYCREWIELGMKRCVGELE